MEQILTALYDAGMKDIEIAIFLNSYKKEEYETCIQILTNVRKQDLEQLHQKQQELERLDYLLYLFKKNKISELNY